MKLFKKLAAVAMAAVLAVGLLAGCSNNNYMYYSGPASEEKILEQFNDSRALVGLDAVENDPTLAAAADKLLDAFAAKQQETAKFGKGYKLTAAEVQAALGSVAQGKTVYSWSNSGYGAQGAGLYVAPTWDANQNYINSGNVPSSTNDFWLCVRADHESAAGYYGIYYNLVVQSNVKLGIATKTINGERFVLAIYDIPTV